MTENGKLTWTNEKRRLSDLIPWPRNPRQIKTDQAKRLVESFDQFGQVETIAIGPGNEVYNGHQRLNVPLLSPPCLCGDTFTETLKGTIDENHPALHRHEGQRAA